MKKIQRKKQIVFIASFLLIFLICVLLMMGGSFFAENDAKIAQDLLEKMASVPADTRLSVIIQYDGEPQSQDFTQLGLLGATLLKELPLIDALNAEISADRISELAQSTRVKRVSPDREVHACLNIASPTVGSNSSITYYNLTGRGVTVAVLDSGIVPSKEELTTSDGRSRVVANIDFVNEGTQLGFDYYGHGSYVSGIIGMKTHLDQSGNIILTGIAPEASIASVKVLDSMGRGKVSSVIEGIQWCVEHAGMFNIRILNLSLSHPIYESCTTDPLTLACEKAWNSGLVAVVAAGNHGEDQHGYGTIGSPGNDPFVLTAGATDDLDSTSRSDDILPSFSSKGPALQDYILKPDIMAPGTSVFSVRASGSYLDTTYPANRVSLDGISYPYFQLNGTSVAAAIVSGTAALMIEKEPSLTPSTVKARLMKSADKAFHADIYTRGAGYLNIVSALLESGVAVSSKSPRVLQTTTGVSVEEINWGSGGFWEEHWIWGDEISWGEDIIDGDLTVWGSSALLNYQNAWNSSEK
ncbi:MAG: S8 family peptidase [Acidobacteriota bacterium]